LLAANDAGKEEPPDEQIGPDDADHYESLIVQRVLSAQMEKGEQNQRHTLFQTNCVIKERSCRLFIDGEVVITWLAATWWRSLHFQQYHTHIHITFDG
jgi:hypothetical protein